MLLLASFNGTAMRTLKSPTVSKARFLPARVWAQCTKELSQFRRDTLTVALAFLLPITTLLIFGYAIRLETKNIPLAIVDYSHSPLSRAFSERFFATNQFQTISENRLSAIDEGKAKAILIIPPDFEREIKAKRPVVVQALVDGTDTNNARVIKSSVQNTTNFFRSTNGLQTNTSLIQPHIRIWFNPGRKEAFYIVPGVYAVILALYPSLLVALAMVREKEQSTIVQVYASSLTASELILGKTLAYFLIAVVQTITIMALGSLLFGIWFTGDPTPFLVGTVVFLFTSVEFGVLIGARASDQSAATQAVATISFLTSLLLSGFIYPLSNIPFPLSLISALVPARYYIDITRDAFVRGTGWPGVWYAPLILALMGSFYYFIAWRSLQKMQLPS
jgi:ABC-2 type transport system permease protein